MNRNRAETIASGVSRGGLASLAFNVLHGCAWKPPLKLTTEA